MHAALFLGCCSAPIWKRPCLLLVAMLLCCHALPPYPRRSNGPTLVAVANANALHLPLLPKPGWPVSPVLWVLWVLRHTVGYLRHPWDPRDRARQVSPVDARCPVTPLDGMINGCDYDYDYMYIYIYIYIYICLYLCINCMYARSHYHVVCLCYWPPRPNAWCQRVHSDVDPKAA